MKDIQQQIDNAHKLLREKADSTLKGISENYQNQLLARIADEIRLLKDALQVGDDRTAEQHRIRADVYKSALDAVKGDR